MNVILRRTLPAMLLVAVTFGVAGCYGWGPHHGYGGGAGHDGMGMDGASRTLPDDAPCRDQNGKEKPCPER